MCWRLAVRLKGIHPAEGAIHNEESCRFVRWRDELEQRNFSPALDSGVPSTVELPPPLPPPNISVTLRASAWPRFPTVRFRAKRLPGCNWAGSVVFVVTTSCGRWRGPGVGVVVGVGVAVAAGPPPPPEGTTGNDYSKDDS